MQVGFPGRWRWRAAFLVPNHYAMTIYTSTEPDHYVFDGRRALAFVGMRAVAEAGIASPLRSHARFTATVNLDALLLPAVRIEEAPGRDVTAVFLDDGSRYRLGFDGSDRLVRVSGPLDLDPFGRGEVTAVFTDFRWVGGRLLPHRTDYEFGGRPLATERTIAVCPEALGVSNAAFEAPWTLPDCPGAQALAAVCR